MVTAPKNTRTFQSLVEVVTALRGPNGCPWDKEQTNETLTQYAIEEAHELADAIDQKDIPAIVEELGDLLLQVILHAEIGRQEGKFTLEDVIQSITEKMIRRHPHVFGDVKVSGSTEVLANWSHIKEQEKATALNPFANLPPNLNALIKAQKIGSKTVRYNFDWENSGQVMGKVSEEIQELREAIANQDVENQKEEVGDVLFTVVQLARHLNIDAEQSLRQTNHKFAVRFTRMRELVAQDQKNYADLKTDELESYWQKAKIDLKKSTNQR